MKRAIDLVGGLVGILILSPVAVVCAVAIRIADGPPIFFRQVRVGQSGVAFEVLKFRTMTAGAGLAVTSAGDERVTGLGRHFRRWKLDELPQLVNVVRGDMSLVGPRPEVPKYVAKWPEETRRLVLSVKPGLTDPATLAHLNEEQILAEYEDVDEAYISIVTPLKLEMYQTYVTQQSTLGDLALLLYTLRDVVLRSRRVS